ncbi:MAG: PqqD family protein [Bacteroidales bacterium]|nr:PqqD family protein [Bacteroidales bacterium]
MKVVEGFRLREICGEFIIVPESTELVNFNKMIHLNATAAYLWEQVSGMEEFTVETLVGLLTDKYDVSQETASKDAAAIADKWVEIGIAAR